MPAADVDLESLPTVYKELPFPVLKKSHVLHCSVHYWYPKYRALTPKSRLVSLPESFISYLRADGIVLPPEGGEVGDDDVEFESNPPAISPTGIQDPSTTVTMEDDSEGEENEVEDGDPSLKWPEAHASIKNAIEELGGKVAPKLNWSSPKDATWINPTNSMDCRSANDIYLMLKSSDFVTHDLEYWDDDCVSDTDELPVAERLQYTLMLRKYVNVNPSVEFRCFVRQKQLIGICQRDLNHFGFLFDMVPDLRSVIQSFFDEKLRDTFPEDNYAFDVYVPAPHRRVWLIDINPWAQRTDPLLFSWLELLTMAVPDLIGARTKDLDDLVEGVDFVRLSLRPGPDGQSGGRIEEPLISAGVPDEEEIYTPEFRLIKRDDPEAYSFNTPQYSAHKLPKDVVQASQSGPGPLREFAEQWREAVAQDSQDRTT